MGRTTHKPQRLLTLEELAPLIHLAPQTIRNRMSQNPESLPPRWVPPGVRGRYKLLWLSDVVDRWIAAQQFSTDYDVAYAELVNSYRQGDR